VSAADRIELRGLTVVATHGALPAEQRLPQPFEVDLDVELDLAAAGASDALADTVDYSRIVRAAEAALAGPGADLLEHLAARVARAAVEACRPAAVASVTVALRKLRPPVDAHLSSAGVRIRRTPDQL
jgi:dihydroneopterin aldolase